MLTRLWRKALHVLDRPGRRALLVVPGSVWVSVTYRAPCLVYWRNGSWIHRYRDAAIPHAGLGRAAPPSVLTAEAREVVFRGYTPREGDVVFDVGAGIGAETLLFSRLVGECGGVVSLEAHPLTYGRLVDLCSANGLDNVIPLQVAASDSDGTTAISDSANHIRNTTLSVEGDGIEVPACRLDTIARELGLMRIDLLKMNIEGSERVALHGLGTLLASTRHVVIGCHDFLADEGGAPELRTKAAVRALLTDNGFAVTAHDDAAKPWRRDYLYGVNMRSYDRGRTPVA
jgi:FkbM family methyltransferase